jgi:hypothetical protein
VSKSDIVKHWQEIYSAIHIPGELEPSNFGIASVMAGFRSGDKESDRKELEALRNDYELVFGEKPVQWKSIIQMIKEIAEYEDIDKMAERGRD